MAPRRQAAAERHSSWPSFWFFPAGLALSLWLSLEFAPLIPRGLAGLWSQVHRLHSIRYHHPDHSMHLSVNRGEGCSMSMGAAGVARNGEFSRTPCVATKQHGNTPNSSFPDYNRAHHLISNHKRSFRRAVRRAQRDGFAWYRGKLYDASALGTIVRTMPTTSSATLPYSTAPSTRELRNRVHLFTWNCGGLGRSKLEEILAWARPQPIQILALQEIRWDGIKEWSHDAWYLIAAGGHPRQSTGVLVAVRKTFCSLDQLSWQSVLDGRLLHVRIHQQRPLDILNFYQKTYQNTPQDLQTRATVFQLSMNALLCFPHEIISSLLEISTRAFPSNHLMLHMHLL